MTAIPREARGGPRAVSIAYLALVREARVAGAAEATWRDWLRVPPLGGLAQRAGRRCSTARSPRRSSAGSAGGPSALPSRERRERADIVFGLGGVAWDGERVLERYELLYEAGLVRRGAA